MNRFGQTRRPRVIRSAEQELEALDSYELDRFPQVFSAAALIPPHQLGWRMAVLPFRSAGAPVGYGIALGMAEEISGALSRFRSPRLVASATFWDGAGPAADAMGQCRAYSLDYIIDGTIQVIGEQIRVTVTLLDVVLDFEVIWSGHFDDRMNNLFALQTRIASETVAQVDPELFQRVSAFQAPQPTEIAAAHHSVLTAIQSIFRLDRLQFMRARELLAHAIELDPDYAAAHAWMAYWCFMAVGQGWVERPRDVVNLAGTSAERAVQLDPLDARAIAIAGHVKAFLLHDVRSAVAMHARAIEMNPNLPIAWTLSSCSKCYSGEHATAIRHALMSKSLSPRDPHMFLTETTLMTAYFFNRQLDEAELLSEAVLARHATHAAALNVRLAVLGHLGRTEQAVECLARLRQIEPSVTVESIASRAPLMPGDKAYYAAGLKLGGVPD